MIYFTNNILYIFEKLKIYLNKKRIKNNWGLGIGDWGLGIGGLGVGAKTKTPNPKTQKPQPKKN